MLFGLIGAPRQLDDLSLPQKPSHAVGWLGTLGEPIFNSLLLQDHPIVAVFRDHRVVGSNPFDKTAVAGTARVCYNDAVKRAFLRATAGESNFKSHRFLNPPGRLYWLT